MSEINDMTIYEICLLHSQSDRVLRLVIAKELEPYNITMMQWLLLATTASGSANGTRMTELSESLNVTMPQITALMNDLTKKNLVKQKINSADRRSRRLMVTKQGKDLVSKATKALETNIKNWFRAVPEDQLDNYLATIKQLSNMGSARED